MAFHKLKSLQNLGKSIRNVSSLPKKPSKSIGFLIDIDGVIFRGREVLPFVHDAFQMIMDDKGNFKFPVVFLTNGTHTLRITRAQRLSEALGTKITSDQVVLAHTPLRMFKDLHEKHVLMVGQGPVVEIGESLGFKNITTLSDLAIMFPHLDCVDFQRRRLDPKSVIHPNFEPIEAIILLGEPRKWETALQLLVDVLITNGNPAGSDVDRGTVAHPHVPVIACNLDLLWMAETHLKLPRFGHGIFLTCLETVYKKLTGHEIQYQAILGKPSELSYLQGVYCAQKAAFSLGLDPIETLYVIGDNPQSDVVGANLFSRYLREGNSGRFDDSDIKNFEEITCDVEAIKQVRECIPVLVKSGLYHERCEMNGFTRPVSLLLNDMSASERRFLQTPKFVENNLHNAIEHILKMHGFM
uniref:Cat eye syndrome critical region protein 5 n=1 Tax=Panagrellus redivivus TaxID=6233 RepID=A0A7E4W1K4_PANRE